jgi:hypothetical protein
MMMFVSASASRTAMLSVSVSRISLFFTPSLAAIASATASDWVRLVYIHVKRVPVKLVGRV